MVGVVVGRKNTFNRHSISFDNVDEIIDMPRRVDEQTRSGCSVTDRIRKVDHLRRKVIADGKVATGKQLAEVETVVFHGFERTLHSVEMSDSAGVGTDSVRYGVIGTGMMGVEHSENIPHFGGAIVSTSTVDSIRQVGPHNDASYLEHVDFLAAIRSVEAAKVTLLDGMRSVAIGVAAHQSIECGRPVGMSEVI